MPEFLDEFVSQVRSKRDRFSQQLVRGREGVLDEELSGLMTNSWTPLERNSQEVIESVAVDGSQALRSFASGCSLYIVRSLAIKGRKRLRELEIDSFFSRSRTSDINNFVTRKMEWIETKVAQRAILEFDLHDTPLLIDGSLYGRMVHLPADGPAEGQRDYILRYFQTYLDFIETCRSRNMVLIGISKDSKVSILRNHFLSMMFSAELDNITDEIEPEAKQTIHDIFENLLDSPLQYKRQLRRLKQKYRDKLDRIQVMLDEALACRPDIQLIKNFIKEPGHSQPLELGPYSRYVRRLNEIQEDPIHYAEHNFRQAAAESKDEAKFLDQAVDVLTRIQSFPTIISFYVLLDQRDTPLRVDVPSWLFGLDHSFSSVKGYSVPDVDPKELVKILQGGYGGLRNYNIFLKRADEEVKLNRKTMDELYTSALEKILGLTLVHTRGYRRVKYP